MMTLHRCQAVALDSSRLNPSIRLLIAMKLMDVIVTPLAQCRDTAFPIEEGSATAVNKLPFFSLICDHCDIFAAFHNSGLRARLHVAYCRAINLGPRYWMSLVAMARSLVTVNVRVKNGRFCCATSRRSPALPSPVHKMLQFEAAPDRALVSQFPHCDGKVSFVALSSRRIRAVCSNWLAHFHRF